MHTVAVTCAVSAPRPEDWSGVIFAIGIAEQEAKRQGVENPQFRILTPEPEWYASWIKSQYFRRKPVAVLAVGFCEKE